MPVFSVWMCGLAGNIFIFISPPLPVSPPHWYLKRLSKVNDLFTVTQFKREGSLIWRASQRKESSPTLSWCWHWQSLMGVMGGFACCSIRLADNDQWYSAGRGLMLLLLPTENNECSVRLGQVTDWVNSATFPLSPYINWQMLAVFDSPGWGQFNKVKKSPGRPCDVCFIIKSCLVVDVDTIKFLTLIDW